MKNFKTKDLMIVISPHGIRNNNKFNCDDSDGGDDPDTHHCTHCTDCTHASTEPGTQPCTACTRCTNLTHCTSVTDKCTDTEQSPKKDEMLTKANDLHKLKTTILKLQQEHSKKIAPDALVAN
jgi:hypothetical protein